MFSAGVANFNGQHGCLKCTTIGEFSHVSHTNVFPRTICEKRTDANFREKRYGSHHKYDSPFLQLKSIDMIEQFPIGDSLHLLHLGLMKRLLSGWKDGYFRNSDTKWPARTTLEISRFLLTCKMPSEIHRAVRGLDCLAHWKGTEYRTFLHYVGIVALKKHLSFDVYEHFLILFCAVTICSSKQHIDLLPLAETLLNHFIERFCEIYGAQYITSNVHNLAHLVDDVRRYGELETFSSYPFENVLGHIKKLLRNGTKPLVQAAKRITEQSKFDRAHDTTLLEPSKVILAKQNEGKNVPSMFKSSKLIFYSKLKFDDFSLSTDMPNKWFLTKNNEIVGLKNILCKDKVVSLFGSVLQSKYDYFDTPIKSSVLDIYASKQFADKNFIDAIFHVSNIKCKLVRVELDNTYVFTPLLHTMS